MDIGIHSIPVPKVSPRDQVLAAPLPSVFRVVHLGAGSGRSTSGAPGEGNLVHWDTSKISDLV